MKLCLIFLFSVLTTDAFGVCLSPVSRVNVGTNAVLTSVKYNADLNTAYNRVNNLPGDCVNDNSLHGDKISDVSIPTIKLKDASVTTAKIADGAITAAKLAAAIENLVPVGVVLPFGGSSAPAGYLLGQGQSLSRTTYAPLFAVYGTAFGAVDGNSFNIPDCRGRFMRFTDSGAGRDPDKASRTAMATGGNAGDAVGSIQGYQLQAHTHNVSFWKNGSQSDSYPPYSTSSNQASLYLNWPTSSTGGNETRPINFNVNCIIKY